MNRARSWWFAFAACAAFLIAAMIGISILVLRMEQTGFEMRADADRNAELGAALWDMESWLIAHLGREASRPYDEYQSYFPADNVYTRYLSKIAPGDVYAPSPLLTFDSELFPIHFQIDPSNALTSPQVPTGNELDLAQATLLPEGWIDRKNEELAHVNAIITYDEAMLYCRIASPPQQMAQTGVAQEMMDLDLQGQSDQYESTPAQQARNQQEFERREEASSRAQQVFDKWNYGNVAPPAFKNAQTKSGDSIEIASFIPIWIDRGPGDRTPDDAAPLELIFLREVHVGAQPIYQGFRCNWPRMREELISQVVDRFPDIRIVPITSIVPADEREPSNVFRLASIPARIEAHLFDAAATPLFSPARATLGIAWVFVLLAISAAGLTLRSTIDFARRRSRFASAVTHELRTPLTTFQMYSEMLADGMVREPDQQKVYHETLREESTRLNAIVENVLAYARIEEGRASASHVERIALGRLFQRVEPAWARRAAACSARLDIDLGGLGDHEISIDVDSFDQILTNLIDNACKYGCASEDPVVRITVRVNDARLRIEVSDHGPGIDPSVERVIFQPFDRGTIEPGSATPGVGLGLALSRELANRLGGSLTHCRPPGGRGACFVLQLPLIG